jgi:hypothetical protein
LAAAFMRSSARRSLGFSKLYFAHILSCVRFCCNAPQRDLIISLLGKRPTIYPDHNPCVWEQVVWLLEGADIFKSVERVRFIEAIFRNIKCDFSLGICHAECGYALSPQDAVMSDGYC